MDTKDFKYNAYTLISLQRWEDGSLIALGSYANGGYVLDCRIFRQVLGPINYRYEHAHLDEAIHHMANLIKITQKFHGIGTPIYY